MQDHEPEVPHRQWEVAGPGPRTWWQRWLRVRHHIRIVPLWDDGWIIRLLRNGREVGYANVCLNPESGLHLDDLRVDDDHQDRGYGTMLIEQVINLAQEHQAAVIYGEVVQRDLDRNPDLLGWYERRGFTIGPAPENDTERDPGSRRVASIHMAL